MTICGLFGPYGPGCQCSLRASWYGGHNPADLTAQNYCCPTPPVSAASCRAGPAPKTQYSNLIHKKCPSVYSYAYMDGAEPDWDPNYHPRDTDA